MKFLKLTMITLLLTFASGSQAGTLVANKVVDISFDDFCDGLHLIINQKTGLVTGNRTGPCLGETINIIGTVGSSAKLGAGLTLQIPHSADPSSDSFLMVIDDTPRKWSIYFLSGDGAPIDSGTYSKGTPPELFGEAPTVGDF